jgi:hypothetical protein
MDPRRRDPPDVTDSSVAVFRAKGAVAAAEACGQSGGTLGGIAAEPERLDV